MSGFTANDHTSLSNLTWLTSGHLGTANTVPVFNGSGVATEYTMTGTGTVVALQNSPTFITPSLGVATATSINNLSLSQDNTDFNIKVGKDSGLNLLAGANNNTFVGYEAGKSGLIGGGTSPDSSDNTAVGYQSFYSNTTGGGSTALGSWTMFSNTTGQDNTALGYYSMYSNTTGSGNTGVGEFTLSDNNGDYNVAVGLNSLTFNTLGNNNSSYGASSLKNNTTGSYNVAVGNFAGRYLADGTTGRISGNNGLYLGYNSKSSADGTDNEIVIGYNAIGKGSNTAVYGNSSMTKHIFEAGNVGIGTISPLYTLHTGSNTISGVVARFENSTGVCDVNPTTSSLVCSSDISLKKNIVLVAEGDIEFTLNKNIEIPNTILDKLNTLTPVTYNWLTELDGDKKHVGLIAQEVEQLFPDVVFIDPKTGNKSIAYTNFIPYTIEAIKEMNLKLLDMNDMEKENSFRDSLVAWFGNEMNGITEFFTKKIRTEQVCLKKSDGTDFCVNGDQLEEIINRGQINTGSSTTIKEPEIIPTEVTPPEDTMVSTDSPTEIPTGENSLAPDILMEEIPKVVEEEQTIIEADLPSQNEEILPTVEEPVVDQAL